MKKIFALALAAALAFSLTACGGKPASSNVDEAPSRAGRPSRSTADSSSVSQASSESQSQGRSASSESSKPAKPGDIVIAEQILYEENDIKITAKDVTIDDYSGDIDLNILIENNSSAPIKISSDFGAINECMVPVFIYTDVPAGKKVNDTLDFDSRYLELSEISTIGLFEIIFKITPNGDYKQAITSEIISIKTADFDNATMGMQSKGKSVLDKDGVSVTYVELILQEDYRDYIVLQVFNTTDSVMQISIEEFSVNGFMIDGYGGIDLLPGKSGIILSGISKDKLAENKITSYEEISFKLRLITNEVYSTKFISDEIIITP